MQLAALSLLEPSRVAMEKVSTQAFLALFFHTKYRTLFKVALQKHFKAKRDYVLDRLHKLNLDVDIPPTSTFYIWLNLERLPAPLNNGLVSVHLIPLESIY